MLAAWFDMLAQCFSSGCVPDRDDSVLGRAKWHLRALELELRRESGASAGVAASASSTVAGDGSGGCGRVAAVVGVGTAATKATTKATDGATSSTEDDLAVEAVLAYIRAGMLEQAARVAVERRQALEARGSAAPNSLRDSLAATLLGAFRSKYCSGEW
jgi:hypothetical protein